MSPVVAITEAKQDGSPQGGNLFPFFFILFKTTRGGIALRAPPHPLTGYAGQVLQKNGEANVPGRVRGSVVPSPSTHAVKSPAVATTEAKQDGCHTALRITIVCAVTRPQLRASFWG